MRCVIEVGIGAVQQSDSYRRHQFLAADYLLPRSYQRFHSVLYFKQPFLCYSAYLFYLSRCCFPSTLVMLFDQWFNQVYIIFSICLNLLSQTACTWHFCNS